MTDHSTVKLLGISGSLRTGSYSTAVLEALRAALAPEVELKVFRLNDVPLYNQDEDTDHPPAGAAALRAAIAAADGVILASPEYNYGTSGAMKNAVDWGSRPYARGALIGKPALVLTSSPGSTGGIRAQAQLRETLSAAGARVVTYPHLAIPNVLDKVDGGAFTDEKTRDFVLGGVKALVTEIRLLASAKAA
ncbi:NAD(P)H-dependent oxidoreductase [Ancylobacter sp. MQZ15Z-1]|uniref:NAD(P)H-dependent oxidoreductase n=1 Tax=Ancylobacter mangrovi TaxID=2972472 RepID=A0A9X2P8X0_9HYPH|nr:NAD(P)H-dependent oxidoreductase [Ancylobacter mangrovi]MCS0494201.1 NAD(P)H-dependent oxidoreductase [Ancylobacter mangrovi]